MVFSSIVFLFVYLPIVLGIYYIIPSRWLKWRNVWLLLANLVFYGWGEPVYITLMILSIVLNYGCGIVVGNNLRNNRKKAKIYLVINIILNISILLFFKYFDLIVTTLSLIPGINIPTLGLALPIGISFYTFQAMSYPIDVFREDANIQKNPLTFGCYISLFPQLIAGPIVRYKDVANQLSNRTHTSESFAYGIRRFVFGLGKKVLIANNIGALWNIYSTKNFSELTVIGSWLGIIAFTLQIYFDFSGYSDMAIGLGRMLGFEFLENFNYPYISKSITEFWRRWHISLGTWFRDYVYIPLGGNRKGLSKQIINILVVWALTGIWHGANWTFLVWGLYYALFLIIEKTFFLKVLKRIPGVISHIYTLFVVTCGWAIFQLDSLSQVWEYFKAMFGFGNLGPYISSDLYYLKSYSVIILIAIFLSTDIVKKVFVKIPYKVQNVIIPIMILGILVLSTAYLVDSTYNPFLYFRF